MREQPEPTKVFDTCKVSVYFAKVCTRADTGVPTAAEGAQPRALRG